MNNRIAKFHLPGLFEFNELYKRFIPLYFENREYFYDFVDISSIYGCPQDHIWSGGRFGGVDDIDEILELLNKFNISARLTFSNSLINEKHLNDKKCNELVSKLTNKDGVIIYSDLLLNYLKKNYPGIYFVSSTTKTLTAFNDLLKELRNDDFKYVVPDFRLNKAFDKLNSLSQVEKDKIEFLVNECCYIGCNKRKECYENVSKQILDDGVNDFKCVSPDSSEGYIFSKAMLNPSFISIDDIKDIYLKNGFTNFKIEGRSLGSAVVFEMLLYYLVKPEYQLIVREKIYLNSNLDIF